MASTKVAIALDEKILGIIDRNVKRKKFSNRSQVIQIAVIQMLKRPERNRLARECAKLNPEEEKAMANEAFGLIRTKV